MWLTLVALAIMAIGPSVWIVWLWKRSRAPRWMLVTLTGLLVGVTGYGVLGMLVAITKTFGSVGGSDIDPSQKARILAEGVAEAMNCINIALVGLGVLVVPVLVAITGRYRARSGAMCN